MLEKLDSWLSKYKLDSIKYTNLKNQLCNCKDVVTTPLLNLLKEMLSLAKGDDNEGKFTEILMHSIGTLEGVQCGGNDIIVSV
jgi:hypothetical protein